MSIQEPDYEGRRVTLSRGAYAGHPKHGRIVTANPGDRYVYVRWDDEGLEARCPLDALTFDDPTSPSPNADSVRVRTADLRLLLQATESFVGTTWPANSPVVSAIDRMGDEVCKVTQRAQIDRSVPDA